jgi:hypothetical protein
MLRSPRGLPVVFTEMGLPPKVLLFNH